jgi:hypothetical protein
MTKYACCFISLQWKRDSEREDEEMLKRERERETDRKKNSNVIYLFLRLVEQSKVF